jgi:hypothetical protein
MMMKLRNLWLALLLTSSSLACGGAEDTELPSEAGEEQDIHALPPLRGDDVEDVEDVEDVDEPGLETGETNEEPNVEPAPVEEAEETPVEAEPIDDEPIEEAPIDEEPIEEEPIEEPIDDEPIEEVPAEEPAPVDEVVFTLETNLADYLPGDTVVVSGEAPAHEVIAVRLFNPNGQLVSIAQTSANADGTWQKTLTAFPGAPSSSFPAGTYTVDATATPLGQQRVRGIGFGP